MIAEQTAAYQKQMWLSQLQVTNPQAYQVPYSPHPTFLSDSCWNNSSQPFAPLLEPVPEGVTVTEFSVTAQSLENCCLSKSLSWLALFSVLFPVQLLIDHTWNLFDIAFTELSFLQKCPSSNAMASWLKPIVHLVLDSLRDREHPMNRQIM